MNYNKVEEKWQSIWEEKKYFESLNKSEKEKYYILVEFPYPSGSGLHVGHIRSYTALDAMARVKRAMGYNVLFPMGWDAFGAPAEQYAIKNKVYPSVMVNDCIKVFKKQIKSLGMSFDWSREINTTDPNYYKWTQWQFLQFFKAGMAYKAEKEINWCPTCKTGLSNEDSSGGICERCGSLTTKKLKNQWLLKMRDYAESLIEGLNDTEFQEKIKLAQINWIGKSIGADVRFKIEQHDDYLEVFTTRPDTLFGVTFMVMSPEHPYLKKYAKSIKNNEELIKYQEASSRKSEIERTDNTREKTGIKLEGLTAINPVNKKSIEIWISDYVLANYGTGAIMAVPAHDERDYAYATKYNIPIVPVIEQITGEKRENEKQKTSIVAVLYDEKQDKYLTLNWGSLGGRLFIGGSVDENESLEECAVREIAEETGYTNIELIRKTMPISHHYFAYNKNQAYEVQMTGFLFKLISDEKSNLNLDETEKNKFEIEFVNQNVIDKEITDEGHKTMFNNLINPSSFDGEGIMINSEFLNGIDNKEEAIEKVIKYLSDNKLGKKATNYRLQDWIFSRQRFWGEPVPIIECSKCGYVAVPEQDLPVILPDVESYEPTDTGESPLSKLAEWVNVPCPKCGNPAKRETDTMPNWAGSSWYWIRYMDANNDNELASMEAMKYWGAVDYYNGGMEHAARHLLYARFWNQFLYDQGIVPVREPFKKRVAHGMILGSDGEKMSKSKGNVVNPEEMVENYGADALRTYEMFIGDYSKDALWDEFGLKGCRKFLDRVYRLKDKLINEKRITPSLEKNIHKTIKKVTDDLLTMNYNTAVSALMILLNDYEKENTITSSDYRILVQLLNPIAPHITEEINEECQLGDILVVSPWPKYDEIKIIDDEVTIGVQVNGKLRASIVVNNDDTESSIKEKALAEENIIKHLDGKEVLKIIIIPKKIVSIVVK